MKSTQKILLHGSKAPAIVIFGALIIEYAACFMKYGISLEYGLLLLGYMVLCAMITCNNHGKKVRIRFLLTAKLRPSILMSSFQVRLASHLCQA